MNAEDYEALTPREYDIFQLIGQGLSNKEIAQSLHLTLDTVKDYNTQIFSKLYVSNRTQAVLTGIALGLLPIPTLIHAQSNLPVERTPFIGREAEIVQLKQLILRDETRLLTITGPGGIGKSRLANKIAQQLSDPIKGVYHISLVNIDSAPQFIAGLSTIFRLPFSAQEEALQQLMNYLREKHFLLVMDNFEHFLAGGEILSEILAQTHHLKAFVTSRERLRLYGEIVYPIEGLPYAGEERKANDTDYSAHRLFISAARYARHNFRVTASSQVHISRICRLVEGFPLALDLAASWIHTLSVEQIAQEISKGLDILSSDTRDLDERHRSIRVVFGHSFQMLPLDLQEVFLRLSIFRGGFDYQAARVIAGVTLSALNELINKSLLYLDSTGRYQFHELIRQFGEEKLSKTQESHDQVLRQHMSYFAELLRDETAQLYSNQEKTALERLDRDADNIRYAWRNAARQQNTTLIGDCIQGMIAFFDLTCRFEEGYAYFHETFHDLEQVASPFLTARLHAALGVFGVRLSHFEEAEKHLTRSIESLYPDHPFELGASYEALGVLERNRGNLDRAITHLQQSLAIYEELRQPAYEALALMRLGDVTHMAGRGGEAQKYHDKGLAIFKALEYPRGIAAAYHNIGHVTSDTGDYNQALIHYQASLEIYESLNVPAPIALICNKLGNLYTTTGDLSEAENYFRRSYEIAVSLGNRSELITYCNNLGVIAYRHSDYDEAWNWYNKALTAAREINNRMRVGIILNNLGKLMSDQGKLNQAIELFLESTQIRREIGYLRGLIYSLVYLGDVYVKQEQIDAAWVCYLEALQLALDSEIVTCGLDVLKSIGAMMLGQQDTYGAILIHLILHHEATDALARAEAQHLLEKPDIQIPPEHHIADWVEVAKTVLDRYRHD